MIRKHYLARVAEDIDKTHPGLGRLAVTGLLAIKARKVLLVVSPRGCGKSTVTNYLASVTPGALLEDRLSVSGLMGLQDKFGNFKSVIIVDDIAKTGTPYSRVSTITSIAELTMSGYIHSSMSKMHYDIEGFKGSAVINIQPVLLRHLVQSDEWEASIQDKTMRAYHLQRPLNPNPKPIYLKIDTGVDFDKVKPPRLKGTLWEALKNKLSPQWGLTRLHLHAADLLRAAAAYDWREEVKASDFRVCIDALSTLQVEELVFEKQGFESGRNLNHARLAVLTEYVTHGQFTIEQVCSDYKLSLSQAYRLMQIESRDWRVVAQKPTTYAPTEELEKQLLKYRFK